MRTWQRRDFDKVNTWYPVQVNLSYTERLGKYLYKRPYKCQGKHPYTFKTLQEVYKHDKLDKIIGFKENGEVICMCKMFKSNETTFHPRRCVICNYKIYTPKNNQYWAITIWQTYWQSESKHRNQFKWIPTPSLLFGIGFVRFRKIWTHVHIVEIIPFQNWFNNNIWRGVSSNRSYPSSVTTSWTSRMCRLLGLTIFQWGLVLLSA